MRKSYIHIIAAAMATWTLAACDRAEDEPCPGNVCPTFTATIEGERTRTNGCEWESGDEIGISTSLSTTSLCVYNVCYVATPNENGEFSAIVKNSEEQIYYKSASSNAQVTFNAYYPYRHIDNPTTDANRSLGVSTSDQTDQKSFDYLFASAKGTKGSPAVDLVFTHKMSKVTFVFKNGQDFNVRDITSYSLGNLYMSGKFSITAGAFSGLTNSDAVSMDLSGVEVKEGEPVKPLILIPQSVPGGTSTTILRPVTLEILDRNGVSYKVDLTFPSNKLVAGENYQFTITVSRKGLTVSNCTITDWTTKEDTGWGTGTAASADDPEEEL